MELRQLVRGEQAVSQVVGVVLMVGITVLLAATAGSFFLGLTNDKQTTSPRVAITTDYDASSASPPEESLKLTHESGDTVQADRVDVVVKGAEVSGSTVDERYTWAELASSGPDEVAAGMAVEVDRNTLKAPGDPSVAYGELSLRDATVKVIWTNPDDGQTFVLGDWAGPGAR
jgi:FlaG/FlaF family flagellin (archaellin)